jgi:HSP20 family protein
MQYLAERPSRVNGRLLDFPRSVEDMFQRFWNVSAPRVDAWRPAVDIVETPQSFILRVETPGINPQDIDVTLAGDTLTIRGSKTLEENAQDQTWCLSERTGGSFERSFTLPAPVASAGIEAEAAHGVLTITVLKAEEARPHKISVRTR